MSKKQIIIDGVDVSGCEYCLKMTDYRCTIQQDVYKCLCKENPNCHYKNWKRKEQECERLKLDLIEAKAHGDYLNNLALSKTLDTVSAELDQLKAENDTYKKMLEDEDVRLALIEIRCGERHLWFNKAQKLKQTLTEIKFWVKEFLKRTGQVVPNEIKQILQKISEINHDL